ncbi:MAG: hypothetical protein AAF936_08920 [Pseudomonadota bacterium]
MWEHKSDAMCLTCGNKLGVGSAICNYCEAKRREEMKSKSGGGNSGCGVASLSLTTSALSGVSYTIAQLFKLIA